MNNFEEKIKEFAKYTAASSDIVFFGGAGVSTESGIPDFRGGDGIYKNKDGAYEAPPEVMLSRTYFFENTENFYKFYKSKMLYLGAKPNEAHNILAELEKKGKLKAVITQNIDDLHRQAGSKNVIELHGNVKLNSCIDCGKKFEVQYIIKSDKIPYCDVCGGVVKPEVTLYEEHLNAAAVKSALDYITKADMLIVGGTSLSVYPAANYAACFFSENKKASKKSVIINKSKTSYDRMFDISFDAGIGEVLHRMYHALY
ncbi:MAG: NAD-dependent protein deacylase [Oscillospiraceae bacterium]|nr:NAD-dependent protein deacylase [Oscillospiraceae bacterium]